MFARYLTVLSFVSFGLLSLFVIQMTRRPLCIESKVVERINRLSATKSETVYRCAVNKQTDFSSYFNEQIKDISYRLQAVERILESIEPFRAKVQISISADRPLLFAVQGYHIYIGQQLLESPGHIEKALAKIWYRERRHRSLQQDALLEEVVTDFLVHLESGNLEIGDPENFLATALGLERWPYVVKSVAAYCESPWRRSEDFIYCQKKASSSGKLNLNIVNMSLRPLLATSWIQAYRNLSFNQRFDFIRNLPKVLGTQIPSTPSSGMSLMSVSEAVRNINDFISMCQEHNTSESVRVFSSHFKNELRTSGFQDVFTETSFDFLYVVDGTLHESSEVYKNLMKLSQDHPKLQIALRDNVNLWMLPSRHPIPLKSFGNIHGQRTVVQKCGSYNFSYVLDYAKITEKLLVVESCGDKVDLQYSRYLTEGIKGFGVQNQGVPFIQFHLPSVMMKKTELTAVDNVSTFIQKRDSKNMSFKSLGWQSVEWSEQAQAYQTKAFVDAIEWFRLSEEIAD